MTDGAVLSLQNISMRFGDNLVLDEVNIDLTPGAIHCLMGYNGSGKSTMANIICGQTKPTGGCVVFEGQKRPDWDMEHAVEEGVVIVSGYASLFPFETVYQNMEYSLVKQGGLFPLLRHRPRLKAAIAEFAAKYDIQCKPNTPVLNLTNGDRVLLELLRVRLMGAKVVLLDEIDVVLGARHKKYILELIRELRDDGVAILYVSHKLDIVRAVADEISVLQYGSISHFGELEAFEQDDIVEIMFASNKERPPRIHKDVGIQLIRVHSTPQPVTLHEGEIVGILQSRVKGEAGIYDLLFNDDAKTGEVRILNREVRGLRLENALENGIVVMSSAMMHLSVFPGYSVRQNMLPYNVVRRVRKEERRNEICQRYINILNIQTTPSTAFETLSMGRQRKVFIARSILSKGDVFLFDNPTDSIDSISKVDIYNIINEMKNRGKGILLLSDDPQEILGISDRIVVMHGNRVMAQYDAGGISREKLLQSLENL